MNIKETALRVAEETDAAYPWNMNQDKWIVKFAEALVAELAKENKPVYYLWENKYGDPQQMLSSNSGPHPEYVITALYTLPPTAEQIEQETAEAIAKLVEPSKDHIENPNDYIGGQEGIDILLNVAEAIRSGKWNEYK